MDEANAFLLGGGSVPSAKFENVGDTVEGIIVAYDLRNETDLATGQVKTFDDGQPRKQLVITLQTDERDESIEDDDGTRRIYAKIAMRNAIADATRQHGGIREGGKLAVKYTGQDAPKRRGYSGQKRYKAWYEPPAMNLDDLPGGNAEDDDDAPF